MTLPARLPLPERLPDLLGSARFSAALTHCIVGTAVLAHAIRATMGWAGLVAVVTVLVAMAAGSLVAKRGDWEWRGLLPVSLLLLVGWCAATLLWTAYQPDALGGVLYLAASAFLAVYVGVVRDLIQIVRAVGDVMRLVLVSSLALEVLAGLLIDGPIPFLGIRGALERLGPIQGLLGERTALGALALVAAVTFAVELLTRSVSRGRAVFSLTTALLVASLTRSSVILGTFLVLAVASLAVFGLRHLARQARPLANSAVLVLAAVVAMVVVAFRSPCCRSCRRGPTTCSASPCGGRCCASSTSTPSRAGASSACGAGTPTPTPRSTSSAAARRRPAATPTSTCSCRRGWSAWCCSRRSARSRWAAPGCSPPPSAAWATSGRRSCSSCSWSSPSRRASRSWSGAGRCS
ncbi:hypothetical protein [Clavibacter tessellarius]|uniref:hypothetical protein n=1 Tax=Clavibacter tessellarius TaxID=31965 RepID=UPI00324F527D